MMMLQRALIDETWTKICGLNDVSIAAAIAILRPSAIGLNFYPPSPRSVDDATAAAITRVMPDDITVVGVFVNTPIPNVVRRVKSLPLSAVQFHGDETPELLAEFHAACPSVSIIRAVRRSTAGLTPLVRELSRCAELQVPIAACLIDAHAGSAYGGTGTTLPWDELRAELAELTLPPVILAGGLRPENVGTAIEQVRPWGVDVASGVESSPGVKDVTQVQRFLAVTMPSLIPTLPSD